MNVDTGGDSEGGGKRLGRDDCERTKAGGSGIMAGMELNVNGALSGMYGMNVVPLLAGRGLQNE